MHLLNWKKRAAGICLGGVVLMLLNTPGVAAWIDSELIGRDSREDAARALHREQAIEQLLQLGMPREASVVLVDAVLSADPQRIPEGRCPIEPETMVQVLEVMGCSPEEARTLGAWLSSSELQWLQLQGAPAFAHAGAKVVGINYTALMILLLPVLIAVIVAVAAGQSAAGVALGALAVGAIFVLLVEPKFLFGEKSSTAD